MKILHYVPSFLNGGIETMLVNIANGQTESGHQVGIMVFTDKVSGDLVSSLNPAVSLFVIGKPVGSKNPLYLLKALFCHRRFSPDVFHFHSMDSCRLFPFKPRKERRVVTVHSDSLPVCASKSIDRYTAISYAVRDYFIRETGHADCCVCYNGINTDACIRKREYSSVPTRFLSIGRLSEVKGMDILVSGFAIAAAGNPSIHLDIWGDGPEMPRLSEMVTELNMEERITLCGNVPNDYAVGHIADYDVAIQASRHEGLGIAAIESMVCGVPLIVSTAAGLVEVTDNGRYAACFERCNPEDLGRAISEVSANYGNAVESAVAAIDFAVGKYSISSLVSSFTKVYNSCFEQ